MLHLEVVGLGVLYECAGVEELLTFNVAFCTHFNLYIVREGYVPSEIRAICLCQSYICFYSQS